VTTPISHRTGLARTMNALSLGGTVIAMERFDLQTTLELIKTERVTMMGIVPTVARILLPYLERTRNPAPCCGTSPPPAKPSQSS
jgi:long-chain acyl-CoA synthetase